MTTPNIVAPITRGLAAAVAAMLLCLAVLTGCSADDGGSSDRADAELVPTAEGNTSYPFTLDTWAGQSVLEERPERIAVIGFSSNADALQALDVIPVYTLTDTAWEWRDTDWLDAVEVVDSAHREDPINFERIAAAEPDLIIALNFIYEESDFTELAKIAPVLEHDELMVGDQISWQEDQRVIGEALDLTEAAESVITEAESSIDQVAQSHPEFAGKTITIAFDYPDTGISYYTTTGGTVERFVTRLGFEANPLAEQFVADPLVADENLAKLDADVLVVFYIDEEDQQNRESSELFASLPPVAEGRYVPVVTSREGSGGNASWVLRRGASALSLPWAADVIAEVWLGDIDLTQ